MLLCHLVEELDDVGEVHVPVENDVPVVLDEGEGNEEKEVTGDNEPRGPDCLPDQVDITIGKLTLEVQKKPSAKNTTIRSQLFFQFSLLSLSVCSIRKYFLYLKRANLNSKNQKKSVFNEEKNLVGLTLG